MFIFWCRIRWRIEGLFLLSIVCIVMLLWLGENLWWVKYSFGDIKLLLIGLSWSKKLMKKLWIRFVIYIYYCVILLFKSCFFFYFCCLKGFCDVVGFLCFFLNYLCLLGNLKFVLGNFSMSLNKIVGVCFVMCLCVVEKFICWCCVSFVFLFNEVCVCCC